MKIKTTKRENTLTFMVSGHIDSKTAPEFEQTVMAEVKPTDWVTLDFEKMDYISSAGLRVLIKLNNMVHDKGSLHIIHVSENVTEIFEMTGLSDLLTIL